jgi:hypothetical protein
VVTEANAVYLLGLVTRAEAEAAVEIARTTGGVQKVVRVFEYVVLPPPPPPAKAPAAQTPGSWSTAPETPTPPPPAK